MLWGLVVLDYDVDDYDEDDYDDDDGGGGDGVNWEVLDSCVPEIFLYEESPCSKNKYILKKNFKYYNF